MFSGLRRGDPKTEDPVSRHVRCRACDGPRTAVHDFCYYSMAVTTNDLYIDLGALSHGAARFEHPSPVMGKGKIMIGRQKLPHVMPTNLELIENSFFEVLLQEKISDLSTTLEGWPISSYDRVVWQILHERTIMAQVVILEEPRAR